MYYEACLNQQDATHREKYLKTSWGKRYIKTRIKNYLTGWIYDDRIEFYNPGSLYGGLTVQSLLSFNYKSQIRNKLIAKLKEKERVRRVGGLKSGFREVSDNSEI